MSSNQASKHLTRGGQLSLTDIRMFFQVQTAALKITLIFFIIAIFGFLLLFSSFNRLLAGVYYEAARLGYYLFGYITEFYWYFPYKGHWIAQTHFGILSQPFFYLSSNYLVERGLASLLFSGVTSGILFIVLLRYFKKRGEKQNSQKIISGMPLATPKELKKIIQKNKKASDLIVGQVPLIRYSEPQHILVHGTTGAGKSQLITELLRQIRRRGERVIIYDKGEEFSEEFFQPGDILLNPFDNRCAPWDLWEEAPTAAHLENMAASLIPLHGAVDPFWVDAARTIFSSTAHKMRNDPDRSIEKLLHLLLTMELTDLETYIKGTEGATLASGKIEKTAISIRSIITTYLKSMRFLFGLKTAESGSFSVRNWILNETNKNWLFISSNGENHKALRPLISMWMGMGSLTILSLNKNSDRRIHFYCDEIPSLHKLPELSETAAEARKFGGCFLLGMQSFALMKAVYGHDAANGIWDLLNTRFYFRSPGSTMSKFISEELGEITLLEPHENYSVGGNSVRDGVSMSHQKVTYPVVSNSDIMQLENLQCYVRLPGHYPVAQLSLPYKKPIFQARGFIPRIIPEMGIIEEVIVTTPEVPEPDWEAVEAEAEKTLLTKETKKDILKSEQKVQQRTRDDASEEEVNQLWI